MKTFIVDIQEIKIAVDIVAICIKDNNKFLLLVRRKYAPFRERWALPGGFIKNDEDLKTAALRELKEETGFDKVNDIKQIQTYGNPNRDPRQRVISIAYLLTTDEFGNISPLDDAINDTIAAQWHNLNQLPTPLAFDHDVILKDALLKLD